MQSSTQRARELSQLNALDLLRAFDLDKTRAWRLLFGLLARVPAQRFARQLLAFDDLLGREGPPAAGQLLLDQFARRVSLDFAAPVPADGPLLVLSNHPGMVDAMALWVGIARRDLRIIAAERALLRALPHVVDHLIIIDDQPTARARGLRAAANHLRAGGALLTFPAGQIEPDPALYPDADATLANWSPSTLALARLAPGTQVIPAAVGGVISTTAQRHLLVRHLHPRAKREWAAATLQILLPKLRDTHTRAAFGTALTPDDMRDPLPAVQAQMRGLQQRVRSMGTRGE